MKKIGEHGIQEFLDAKQRRISEKLRWHLFFPMFCRFYKLSFSPNRNTRSTSTTFASIDGGSLINYPLNMLCINFWMDDWTSFWALVSWNPKQPFINGCFNWMIPNLYIGNGCFTKHLFINGCLGFQVGIGSKSLSDTFVYHMLDSKWLGGGFFSHGNFMIANFIVPNDPKMWGSRKMTHDGFPWNWYFYPHLADLYGKCRPIDHSHGSYDLQVVDMSTKITFPDSVQSHHRSTLEFRQKSPKNSLGCTRKLGSVGYFTYL